MDKNSQEIDFINKSITSLIRPVEPVAVHPDAGPARRTALYKMVAAQIFLKLLHNHHNRLDFPIHARYR